MVSGSPNPSLGEAAGRFIASLPAGEKANAQQETHRFARWFGRERLLSGLTAAEVAKYAEHMSASDTDYVKKIELLRTFLTHAKKEGWCPVNLAPHLKARKTRTNHKPSSQQKPLQAISLTPQGFAKLEAEIAELKSRRLQAIDEMRRAAADKDFRENAPLEAAREQRAHLEGRIKELEETRKLAIILDNRKEAAPKASIGGSILLCDLDSGEEQCYTIVSPREVDPTQGHISSASPLGQAVIGQGQGDTIEVATPVGKLRYQIKQVY